MSCAKQEHTIYEIHELIESSVPKDCIEFMNDNVGALNDSEQAKWEASQCLIYMRITRY